MKITPIEIQQHRFRSRIFGYDTNAVDHFLELVADELQELHMQNHELKEELVRTRNSLAQMKSREQALQQTLVTAQQVTEELKKNARREAELVMADARLQGEQILREAEERRLQLIRDIQGIKRQKISFESSLKALIGGHLKLLDLEGMILEDYRDETALLETQLSLETSGLIDKDDGMS
jgi:cell division initiation protein